MTKTSIARLLAGASLAFGLLATTASAQEPPLRLNEKQYLEKRGLVAHRARGRQYIYAPAIDEQAVRRSMLQRLTNFFFGGDQAALVSHLVRTDDIQPQDLRAIRDLLRLQESDRDDDG